jgi:hypothetical protein
LDIIYAVFLILINQIKARIEREREKKDHGMITNSALTIISTSTNSARASSCLRSSASSRGTSNAQIMHKRRNESISIMTMKSKKDGDVRLIPSSFNYR